MLYNCLEHSICTLEYHFTSINNALLIDYLVAHSISNCYLQINHHIMNKINSDYSMKNILIAPCSNDLKWLIEKVEKFTKCLWLKASFFKPPFNTSTYKNFGFMSNKTPPQNEHFNPFEDDLGGLVRNIEFETVKNEFQKKLESDLKQLWSSSNLFVWIAK